MRLQVRRCHNRKCDLYMQRYRPERERDYALSNLQFGLDVLGFISAQIAVG